MSNDCGINNLAKSASGRFYSKIFTTKNTHTLIMKLFIVFLSAIALFLPKATLPTPPPIGEIRIAVFDGKTGEAVENANICVLECEKYYKTDENGYSPKMRVGTKDDTDRPPFSRAKVTLLVYKEGYVDTLVFGVEVYDGICRLGPTVRLFPKIAGEETIGKQYDFPDEKLLRTVIEKYRK